MVEIHDDWLLTNSSSVSIFVSGYEASECSSDDREIWPSISVSWLLGRAKLRSKACFKMTIPPSSSYSRGGWKTPTTLRRIGFPAGVRRVNASPTCRSCLLANERFTRAPPAPSLARLASDDPCFQVKL